MNISNKELGNIYKSIGELPFINMSEENVKMLQSIISELLELRAVNNKPNKK